MTSQDWLQKDFYATLGVAKDSDAAAIKKAYRKRASTMHPDVNPDDPTAEQRFKDLGEAYSVLSDPSQREQYDAVRAMTGGGARFAAGPGGAGAGSQDFFSAMFGGGGGSRMRFQTPGGGAQTLNLEDLFPGFGGGGFGGMPGYPGGSPGAQGGFGGGAQARGRDIKAQVTVSFREAVAGSQVKLGVVGKTITAKLPPAVHDGQKIRLRGQGEPSPMGGPPGDVILTVHVTPHPVFTADDVNLKITVPVTYAEAALGTKIDVPTLDGGTVGVKIPAGTPAGRMLRVKGRGIERNGKRGDLLVGIQVAVPAKLSGKAKDAIKALAEAMGEDDDPRASFAEQAAQ